MRSDHTPLTSHLHGCGASLILYLILGLPRRYVAYQLGEGYRIAGAFKAFSGHVCKMAWGLGKAKGAGISN